MSLISSKVPSETLKPPQNGLGSGKYPPEKSKIGTASKLAGIASEAIGRSPEEGGWTSEAVGRRVGF